MKKLLLLLFIIPVFCFGQVPDPLPNTYVNDLSNSLTQEQIHALNEKILSIEKKSSVQIAIILLTELPSNMSIEDYTLEVGRKWHVGNANNGLVYVAAINQRKQRLEVADNLQGDIPDVVAYELQNSTKPFFRNKDYYGGVNALLDAIWQKVDPVAKEQLKLAAMEQEKKDEQSRDNGWIFLLWFPIFFLLLVAVYFFYLKPRREKRLREQEEQYKKDFKSGTGAFPVLGIAALVSGISANASSRKKSKTDSPYQSSTPIIPSNTHTDYTPPASNNNSDYGNWGSGSSGSSDSGYSGGGSNSDW